jgi:hypothetical protein
MGNNYSSTAYLNGEDKKILEKDIGQKNLKTNFSSAFMAVTILLIIFGVTILAGSIYLSVKIWLSHPDPGDEQDQKIISYSVCAGLFIIILVLGLYYLWYIEPDIRLSDILVTDQTRVATAPLSDVSFKHNMTNLIAHKLGKYDDDSKRKLYANINSRYMVDPVQYMRTEEGRRRFSGSVQERRNMAATLRRAGYNGQENRVYALEGLGNPLEEAD